MYGGHITDPQDKKVLEAYLDLIFNNGLLVTRDDGNGEWFDSRCQIWGHATSSLKPLRSFPSPFLAMCAFSTSLPLHRDISDVDEFLLGSCSMRF